MNCEMCLEIKLDLLKNSCLGLGWRESRNGEVIIIILIVIVTVIDKFVHCYLELNGGRCVITRAYRLAFDSIRSPSLANDELH